MRRTSVVTIIAGIAALSIVAVAAPAVRGALREIPGLTALAAGLSSGPARGTPAPTAPTRVYSVAQFVQPDIGPLWTTHHRAVFLVRGILQRAAMQPVADFILSDSGSVGTWDGGLALASGPGNPVVRSLSGVALLRSLLPPTVENPLLGSRATYRVLWVGCLPSGCARSPWQLASGGT